MSIMVHQLKMLSERERQQIIDLEAEVYPPAFALGESLFDDADESLSICVSEGGKFVGYVLVERENRKTVYIADIVRHPDADCRAVQMLQVVLEEVMKNRHIKYVTADCRSGSAGLVKKFNLQVLKEEVWWCDDREEQMTFFKILVPAR